MSAENDPRSYVGRRAELLAELLLQELEPQFVRALPSGSEFDLVVGFPNREGGTNTSLVEVKGTQDPVADTYQVAVDVFRRLVRSTPPALLLVVDVKRNRFYFSWPADHGLEAGRRDSVAVPVTALDPEARAALRARLAGQQPVPA